MRAIVIGAGMGGMFTALALQKSGVFTGLDVFEQTQVPSTAGAGITVPPNGARLCKWLGVDLDGGDPKGPSGVLDGGRAAILAQTRMIMADGTVSVRPLDHVTAAGDGAGFHHMHRLDLLMCLQKRVVEVGDHGSPCPISLHFGMRLISVEQSAGEARATFADGSVASADVLIGADGINSTVLKQVWPEAPPRRWTECVCYRGLIPRERVGGLRKPDGSPMDHNPLDALSMDVRKNDRTYNLTYWIRGGQLLNVWLCWYQPESAEFEESWGDWREADLEEMLASARSGFAGDPRLGDIEALLGGMENPTKWGLYDRDAFEHWQEGRIALLGDAAHPMLPTFGQAAAQAFEDAAALYSCFVLHGSEVYSALLHYERVRHFRATRFQFASKFLFKHLEPEDTEQRRALMKAVNERDYPVFDHEQRAGDDDSWIYAFDARQIGDSLPRRKLGPWDFRSREAASALRETVASTLWTPPNPLKGDRSVTPEEVAQHATFDDCWIIIRGKVYDISDWKNYHPGGPFVARMYAGKDATAEFGDYHSPQAFRHMTNFCVGRLR